LLSRYGQKFPATKENIDKLLSNANNKIVAAADFLKLGHYNDAISRAYYAFFYAASAILIKKGYFAKTHKGVEILFEKKFIKTGEFPSGVGRWLARTRESREEADYDLWREYDKEQVKATINAAKEFVKTVENKIKFM